MSHQCDLGSSTKNHRYHHTVLDMDLRELNSGSARPHQQGALDKDPHPPELELLPVMRILTRLAQLIS